MWIASLVPPLSVRAKGSEERTLLYACARFDRFASMHLVRRTHECCHPWVARLPMPTPRAFSSWRSLSRLRNRSLTLPVTPQAPPRRLHWHRPVAATHALSHAPRVHLRSQDVSSTTRLGVAASAPGAPSIVPLHRDLTASDVDTRSGFDPRRGIEHPFTPSSPGVRVNGPTSSSEARSQGSLVFRRSRLTTRDAHDR